MSAAGPLAAALVAVGGALGASGRYLLGERIPGRRATVAVNVAGSFLLGATGAAVAAGAPGGAALLVGTGFCGAFTTYSSFAVEMRALAADGEWRTLVGFAVGTVVAALAGAAVGGRVGGLWP
ncbi:fluoride efflux transporter FluC [Candidatus Halobonum tyrrellensis]|uniref:Fluoride-specific ion channel FluC n=1 Tax=Candidatus Halobonum tyrrellensis G22 TaxID=1324957 RepID=V4HA66_9EURY|nr:CrcB family protein [Candidatus Halobonum tyrrellensis]ESP87605.1 CRCB integral membrane protein [Candidatus Halobonum tyrrellensis G22]